MDSRPSMVHPCGPPPAREIVELRLRVGDTWTCPLCGDHWQLLRGARQGKLLPTSAQRPEWVRLNDPE